MLILDASSCLGSWSSSLASFPASAKATHLCPYVSFLVVLPFFFFRRFLVFTWLFFSHLPGKPLYLPQKGHLCLWPPGDLDLRAAPLHGLRRRVHHYPSLLAGPLRTLRFRVWGLPFLMFCLFWVPFVFHEPGQKKYIYIYKMLGS